MTKFEVRSSHIHREIDDRSNNCAFHQGAPKASEWPLVHGQCITVGPPGDKAGQGCPDKQESPIGHGNRENLFRFPFEESKAEGQSEEQCRHYNRCRSGDSSRVIHPRPRVGRSDASTSFWGSASGTGMLDPRRRMSRVLVLARPTVCESPAIASGRRPVRRARCPRPEHLQPGWNRRGPRRRSQQRA